MTSNIGIEELLVYQKELLDNLKNAEKNYKKSPKDRIKRAYLETRLESLEELWNNFKVGHKQSILKLSKEEEKEDSYFEENIYEQFEEIYIQYKSSLKEALQPFLDSSKLQFPTHQQVSTPSEGSTQTPLFKCDVKLPRIQIPTFTGKYEEWQSFYDLFCSLIHNNKSLSPVEKLQYLKTNLSGEPEVLLRNYSITNANYEEAWNELEKRYNNKRYNTNEILRKLFTQKVLQTVSASSIKQLVDTTSTCLKALKNMNVNIDAWDLVINYLVLSKLDSESVKEWEQHLSLNNNDTPTWPELRDFLSARFRSLEMMDGHKPRVVQMQAKPVVKPKTFHSNIIKEEKKHEVKCALCSEGHYIYHCKKFGDMSIKERQDFVQHSKLCFNCLAPSHSVMRCRQSTCCRKCGRRHHSLLHYDRCVTAEKTSGNESTSTGTVTETQIGKPSTLSNDNNVCNIVTNFSKENFHTNSVLLATARVLVESRNGCKFILRALLDQGSQASFVTEATVQLLNLTRKSVSGWVSGVGEEQTKIKHMVSFSLKSRYDPQALVKVNAYVLRSLTTLLPNTNLGTPDWSDIANLELADPGFNTPGKIDILLGAEVYSDVLLDGIIKHPKDNLLAQNTILGWVLSGRMSREVTSAHITSLHVQQKEDELLKLFWEVENEPNMLQKRQTKEERRCEEFYDATTVRDESGRFVVRLPFKKEVPECQNGRLREIAAKRFEYLEKRLSKNDKLREDYHKVINEYLQLNHMIEVDVTDIHDPKAVYLPHHAVTREDKDTTKLRVVFDASCKGVNNVSLNDDLLIGPKLQQDLRHLLMRWRVHKIGLTADIIKMYRMVRVAEEDTIYQRILWRPKENEPVKHFKLLRLTFGTTCAPYLAVKSLHKLADIERLKCPVAAKITKNDFYMDDLMTGGETEDEVVTIYNEMNKLMNLGGFELQKWSSNNENILKYIGEHKRIDHELPLKLNSVVKVLGVVWNRLTDSFEYTINLPEPKQSITKRQILSEVAKVYDPLGWIAPVVVVAKMIIQKLWRSELEWDDTVHGELLEEWLRYRENLIHIKAVSIPRWLRYSSTARKELHAFADASQLAYGAAVYMRVVEEDRVYVNLISAKTKVAPIEKQLSIPRLELCAAVLATKLIYEISQVMDVSKTNLYAWTDSTIVLAWLKGGSSKWTTFVSNRVSDILNILDYNQWGHVATELNPADCASRGLQVSDILTHTIWWNGPDWLSSLHIHFSSDDIIEDTQEEERVKVLNVSVNTEEDFIWAKFSNLSKMLRIMSYCRRWANLKQQRGTRQTFTKHVTVEEMTKTLEMCIKQIQNKEFSQEIKQLKSNGCVPRKSKLRSLCPILDENEILRVSGRIQQSQASYDTRHPIILPAKNHLSRLLITDAHIRTMHGGPQMMVNYLRSKYWILRVKNEVKRCYRECVTCTRYSTKNTTQLMGQLPEVRVTPNKPFRSTGVDYAGPVNIRLSPGRGAKSYKGYICLFVCMVTRAVHLEAVTDLTAKGFIAAFKRFTSRRGHCYDLYSDNGTNFVGADKLLRDMFDNAKSSLPSEIAHLLTLERTTWHFIPPHAPNFGGLWEAGVRSTKTHLKRVIGDTTLTYEELSTVLAQVEACLNSRPISVLNDDQNDPLPLTPGHFLVGEPLLNLADEDSTQLNISHHERWRLTQKMVNDFWNRWYKEYLVNLNQRYKWNKKNAEPEIGDVVILKEDNIPPSKWIMGRIFQKHVGPDNITRVVSIKCKNGILKRPVSKICVITKV